MWHDMAKGMGYRYSNMYIYIHINYNSYNVDCDVLSLESYPADATHVCIILCNQVEWFAKYGVTTRTPPVHSNCFVSSSCHRLFFDPFSTMQTLPRLKIKNLISVPNIQLPCKPTTFIFKMFCSIIFKPSKTFHFSMGILGVQRLPVAFNILPASFASWSWKIGENTD